MNPHPDAQKLIEDLALMPHPEGGYFREIHRSPVTVQSPAHAGERNAYTSIYFLMDAYQHSAWHRVAFDETWFFHAGTDLSLFVLDPSLSDLNAFRIGPSHGEYQLTVPAGLWFAARPVNPASFSLVSCVVGPGFTFADFELAKRSDVLGHPGQSDQDQALIESLLVSHER